MFILINPSTIIKEHIRTLIFYKGSPNLRLISEAISLYFLIPLGISISLPLYFQVYVKESFINIALTSISIITGFLFNITVMIYQTLTNEMNKDYKHDVKQKRKLKLLYQLYVNTSFGVFWGFLTIAISVFAVLIKGKINFAHRDTLFTIIYIYLLAVLFITLLQILKRSFIFIKDDFPKDIPKY